MNFGLPPKRWLESTKDFTVYVTAALRLRLSFLFPAKKPGVNFSDATVRSDFLAVPWNCGGWRLGEAVNENQLLLLLLMMMMMMMMMRMMMMSI